MHQYEREFLVSRICAGYLKYDGDIELKILSPTSDIIYEAQCVYMDTLKKAERDNCLTDNEILHILYSKNLWTEEEEKELEDVLPKHLEWWKVEYFEKFDNTSERARIRIFLDKVKTELHSLFSKKHFFDHLTSHGVATYARWQYIIEKCTVTMNGDRFDWDGISITDVMEFINQNQISETTLREVARNEPWRSIWAANKSGHNLFGKPAVDLSEEQKRLITWSTLYDNIAGSPDCPSSAVIEDDDALDGWLIKQHRESQENKKRDEVSKKIYGMPTSGDVFIPVSDEDINARFSKKDAKKIYELNDAKGRAIVQSRLSALAKHGQLEESELPDVRMENNMATTRAISRAMKGQNG